MSDGMGPVNVGDQCDGKDNDCDDGEAIAVVPLKLSNADVEFAEWIDWLLHVIRLGLVRPPVTKLFRHGNACARCGGPVVLKTDTISPHAACADCGLPHTLQRIDDDCDGKPAYQLTPILAELQGTGWWL